jgi:hypothetical protein
MNKDLRTLLGDPVNAPFAVRYCGAGDLGQCQRDIWAAIDAAGKEIAQAQGSEDPTQWRSDAEAEKIPFVPGLLPYKLRYTNRPTGIQQVISFTGHR